MTRTQEDIQKVADQLVQSAQTSGGSVLGARAGNIVRATVPDFRPESYGVKSLREFISQHVPALRVVGFSGPDPIYGLADAVLSPDQAPSTRAVEKTDLWRVWVSPASPLALSISTSSGQVRALPREADPPAGEVRVLPASLETHRLIAEEFTREPDLPSGLAAGLAAILSKESEDPRPWWQRWQEVLRSSGAGLTQRWYERRRASLEQALQVSLREAGLAGHALEQAFGAVTAASTRAAREAESRTARPITRSTFGANSGAEATREIVAMVVSRMGEGELRALALPLGLVLDAIARHSRNP